MRCVLQVIRRGVLLRRGFDERVRVFILILIWVHVDSQVSNFSQLNKFGRVFVKHGFSMKKKNHFPHPYDEHIAGKKT